MKAHKALRTTVLIVILTVGCFTSAFISPPVIAQSSTGQTTLYFTESFNLTDAEDIPEFSFITLTPTSPTKQNYSQYPPSLFIKNTSKLFLKYSLNVDQWLMWASTWIFYLLDDLSDFDLSEIFPGYELLIPHPMRIVAAYLYTGNESVDINGDIIYNMYFNTEVKNKKFIDKVKVELYAVNFESELPIPRRIKNTTIDLLPSRGSAIYKQQIILPEISYTLKPGDSLLFSVEIIPSNKTIYNFITKRVDVDRFLERCEKFANFLENRTNLNRIQNLGTTLKEILSLFEEDIINITSEDIAVVLNALRSTSFVYDSVKYPSSVSIPAKISEEDIRIYYLHGDKTMDEKPPSTNNLSESKIGQTPLLWTAPAFERNKILKVENTFADLYLNPIDLRILRIFGRKITITATLYDNNRSIGVSDVELTRGKILNLLNKPKTPITFQFTGSDIEIPYDHTLRLGVSLKNNTKLGVLRTVRILYDSNQFPSAVRLNVEETQNIKITDITSTPADNKIIPGGTVEYRINVTSKKADDISIEVIEREKLGDWEIILPETTTVLPDSTTAFQVLIKSKNNLKEAYGSSIDFSIIAQGKTGISRVGDFAEISRDAIQYDIEILGYSPTINISKGENRNFYFIIKNNNTGAIDDVDSYIVTASSKNNWPLIPREDIRNVGIGQTTTSNDARVVIQVPKNTTLSSDTITITVTSVSDSSTSATITVTVFVIPTNFLENIYEMFDRTAQNLGLNELFGAYGAIVLVLLIAIILLFFLIILALLLTLKPVHLICTDRIKEIEPTEKAIFEITLKNPSKKTQSYEIEAEQTTPASKWIVITEPITTVIEGRESKTVQITITPTEKAQSKDWLQVPIHVKKTGKMKTVSLNLLAMIKEGKTLLQIHSVSHGPTEFHPGEKVITSFSVSNTGTITARNVKVFFYLNGKQKNMVEVTIPPGNIADIQMPWIAEKGKNKVRIRIKEP
jgi:hypothetical protein